VHGVLALLLLARVLLVVCEVLVLIVQVAVIGGGLLARDKVYGEPVRADVLHLADRLGGGRYLK
jgi:hypothetical protein